LSDGDGYVKSLYNPGAVIYIQLLRLKNRVQI